MAVVAATRVIGVTRLARHAACLDAAERVGFSNLFSRRRKEDLDTEGASSPVMPTKALARFLGTLEVDPPAVLLDLGCVVGSNVTFFGEQLGCRIMVEDLLQDVDRHVQENRVEALPEFLSRRFPHPTSSIDGILCWDVFDYLPRPAVQVLAQELARVLRPRGALLAFFGTSEPAPGAVPVYTRHVIVDTSSLRHRPYPAARAKQRPLQNRDIQRLFEPLRITEQFLLQTRLREVLFRKPAADVAGEPHAES